MDMFIAFNILHFGVDAFDLNYLKHVGASCGWDGDTCTAFAFAH